MRPQKYDEKMTPREILFPPQMWKSLQEQARIISQELGKTKTASDLVRFGAKELLKLLK
jgi:hypothetical protein